MNSSELLNDALLILDMPRTAALEKIAEAAYSEVLAYTGQKTLEGGLFELAVAYLADRIKKEGVKRMTVGDTTIEYISGTDMPAAMRRYKKIGTVKDV